MKLFYLLLIVFISINLFAQPGSFNLVSPTNGSFASAIPYFDWSDASGVTYYQLFIDGALIRDNIKTSNYQLQSSEAILEGLHTWNVKAINGSGSRQSVETWSVKIDATQPITFDLTIPANNSWTNNLFPTFQWSATNDVTSGLAKYQLWIDGSLNRDNIINTATSIAPANSLTNGSHSWQIKAIDNVGNVKNSSQSWTVKVDNIPPGSADNCVYFDGNDDYAITSTQINTGNILTMEAWIKPNSSYVRKGIMKVWGNYLSLEADNKIAFHYYVGSSNWNTRSSTKILDNNNWYHVAASHDINSGTIKIYINGILDASFTNSHGEQVQNDYLYIGKGNINNGHNYFPGYINEVKLWNYERTQAEIQATMNNVIEALSTNGLLGYWRFNDNLGSLKLKDEVSNSYNLSLLNGAYLTYENKNIWLGGLSALKVPSALKYLATVSPTFSWGVAPDLGVGFQKYQLYIDGILNSDNLLDSSWTVSSPLPYGQHTWFVKGFDILGNNQSTSSRTFYIDNKPPIPFNLLSPKDSGIVNIPTPNLSWETATDYADGSGLSKYQLWINGQKSIDSIAISSTTTSPSTPLQEGKYSWLVKAFDKVGNARQSTQSRLFYVDYNPPTVFSLLSPLTMDTIKIRRPYFKWHASSDAGSGIVKYELIIYGKPVITINPPDTIKQITFDLDNGNYTWYIKAYDRAGSFTNTNTLTFIVKIPLPSKPMLIIPALNQPSVSKDVVLKWNQCKSAEKYYIQVSKNTAFSPLAINDSTTSDTTRTITNLENNTRYFWRTRAKNITGYSVWSDTWNFTTIVAIPTKPALIFPILNQTNVSKDVVLKWSQSKNAEKYFINLAKDAAFNQLMVSDSTMNDTVKTIASFENNTKYYWRVQAKNIAGYGGWSDVYNFTTIVALPAKPMVALQNNLTNQQTTITLKWNKVKDADKYTLQLTKDQTFATVEKNDSTTVDTMKTMSGLMEGKKYYWKVQAKNVAGSSPWSDPSNFTTLLSAPTNLTLSRSDLKEITLSWNDNSKNEDGYIIERKQSSQTVFAVIDTLKGIGNKYLDKKVEQTQTYCYRTKAYTKFAESSYSNEVSIVVVEIDKEEIPTVYSLNQNYPNPFNPTTKFSFGLPERANTKLAIYDVLGREIDILINSELEAGFHEINYNANNLTSGVYFYNIKAGHFSQTKKFMFLK